MAARIATGYEIGLPVERFLLDIMRRLVRDGSWRINEPGSRLWHMDGHLYLIWPIAGEEIAAVINQEKIPGLPRTPNSILDMLVDRKLAHIREDQVEGNRYWAIAPAVLAEKIPNIRLTAIRLRDTTLVIAPAPPLADGIQSGKKSSVSLIHVDSSGVLCLKWPDALNGYGLESKAILDEMSRRNWLVLDPLSPFRKVVEIEIESGEKWKVVRLQPVVRQLMEIGAAQSEPVASPTQSSVSSQQQPTKQGGIEMVGEDTRLEAIQSIIATLRDGVREGILTSEQDGDFIWIPSRKAEPLLIERLKLKRMKIMQLGGVVPDAFISQTRKRSHCYRIPAMPATDSAPK